MASQPEGEKKRKLGPVETRIQIIDFQDKHLPSDSKEAIFVIKEIVKECAEKIAKILQNEKADIGSINNVMLKANELSQSAEFAVKFNHAAEKVD